MIMKTLILADVVLSVAGVSYGPQGFYCVDDFLTPNGEKLLFYFDEEAQFPTQNFSTGRVTLYGLTSTETVVSADTRFTASATAKGRLEQLLSISPYAEFERFCKSMGVPKTFLSTNGLYDIQSDSGEMTDLVEFPASGSAHGTSLRYEACYESLGNQNFESADGLEFIFGLSAGDNVTIDRRVTIKKDKKSLGTYEFAFDGLNYPFDIRLVKNRGRYFVSLLRAFDKDTPLSNERLWMEGKALSYDPLTRKVILHK